jgi:sensor histidine kinase YesM
LIKKITLLLHLAACFFPKIQAQQIPTLTLSISRDSQTLPLDWTPWLLQNADIYGDKFGEKTFAEIEQQQFMPIRDYPKPDNVGAELARTRYWLRVNIKNVHPTDSLHLVMRVTHQFVHYYSRQDPPPMGFCADMTARGKGTLPYNHQSQYPIHIAPKGDSIIVYVRFGRRGDTGFDWWATLSTPEGLASINKTHISNFLPKIIFSYFNFGILTLMAGIGFLFYLFNRQTGYAYYTAYVVAMLLTFVWNFEMDFNGHIFILFSYFPKIIIWSEGITVGLIQILYCQFLIHILDLEQVHPRLYILLRGMILSAWLYLAIDLFLELFFFDENYYITGYVAFRVTMAIFTLLLIWWLAQIKGNVARFIFLGTMSLYLGMVISTPFLLYMNWTMGFDHLFTVKMGTFIETLFFTAALSFKNKQMDEAHRQKLVENNALLTQIIEQTELKTKIAEAELKHTRAQMRTHLLFNVVNSAKNTVLKEKPAEAAAQLADLAAFMRLSLAHSRHYSVSLGEELNLLKQYIELEKRRLSDAFQLDWQVENAPSLFSPKIPTLLLQPFAENAILHGLLPKNEEKNRLLTIKVIKESDAIVCTIEDNGVGRQKAVLPNESLGLALTKERILLFNELNSTNITWTIEDVVTTEGGVCGTLVVVRIPIF